MIVFVVCFHGDIGVKIVTSFVVLFTEMTPLNVANPAAVASRLY